MDLRTQPDDLRGISLCAGYAGLDLGLHIAEPRYRTVAFVEREAHAAATLVARMEDASLAPAPVWDDLKSFDGRPWRGRVHIVTAGYPCQPFSQAGLRRGKDDPRHLWPDVARVVDEVRPEWVFCENVEGHIDLGLADVARGFSDLGYTTKAGLFTAREAGASHRRRRIFILAHADSERCREFSGHHDRERTDAPCFEAEHDQRQREADRHQHGRAGLDALLVGPEGAGPNEKPYPRPLFAPSPGDFRAWTWLDTQHDDLQPALLRASDGLADRLDRTRAAGNGVCSLAAAIAWKTLVAAHRRSAART